MQEKLQPSWRGPIIFTLMIIMIGSLFISRAVLSGSIIALLIVSFFHKEPARHLYHFFSSPLLWGMSLLFFLPLLSGFWSDDKKEWGLMMLIKLPLFLLPLAFAGPITFSKRQWEWLAYIFILWIMWASIGSMFHYVNNAAIVNEGYLRAKTMLTPLQSDHVRFSWLISVAILWGGWICFLKRGETHAGYWVLVACVIWLIIFLHILAARTGLISFYIMLSGVMLYLIIKRTKWKYSIVLFLLIIALPFVAYKTLPTFQNKVKYFLYDLEQFKRTVYLPGTNDAVRIISVKAGWQVMNRAPLSGVGFGDVIGETKKYYDQHYPSMTEADKIYPSSELIMFGAGAGLPGVIIFIFAMAIPFFTKTSNKLIWYLLNIAAAFSLLFDPALEVQFGVFAYSFIVLWCWKWLSSENCNLAGQ